MICNIGQFVGSDDKSIGCISLLGIKENARSPHFAFDRVRILCLTANLASKKAAYRRELKEIHHCERYITFKTEITFSTRYT